METIISQFQQIAGHHADALALVSDNETVTYGALNSRSKQIAWFVAEWFRQELARDVDDRDIIAVCLDKSADLYASILAILAVGASYVPIDPKLSNEAQAAILARCKCKLVIAKDDALIDMKEIGRLSPKAMASIAEHNIRQVPESGQQQTRRCYTIFTSGSTGQPKGVQINNQNLLNLVNWVHKEFSLHSTNRVLQYSTINFDASVLDIFPTLLAGAALCIPTEAQRLSAVQLADFCERHHVDHAFLPPSLLSLLDAKRFPTLATVLTGGETSSSAAISAWQQGRRLYNLYGPTECTVLVSFKRMQADTAQNNIGQAISGVRLHVLDENMQLAPRGELHVAGLSVSPGYLGDAPATHRRFMSCPDVDEGALYKTGDIVEIDAAGDIHFLGRADRQVKVRGYRIELEEIEAALMKVGCIQAAVKMSSSGALTAYFAAQPELTIATVRGRLEAAISDYKVPQFFLEMKCLPLRPSGKVDYEALPDLQETPDIGFKSEQYPDSNYAAIFELWAEELNLSPSQLHINANFRELGGTSLNIIRLLDNTETRFGIRIPFLNFLDDPTPQFIYKSLN